MTAPATPLTPTVPDPMLPLEIVSIYQFPTVPGLVQVQLGLVHREEGCEPVVIQKLQPPVYLSLN